MPLQRFIDNTFYYLFIFTLIFGVIFYDALGFNFTDELCALFLCGLYAYYVFHTKNWSFNKLFLITIFVFLFYLVYSLLIKSNTKGAIISDFIIQLKPYIAFFTVYAFAPVLNKQMKKNLSLLSIICSVYLLIIAISYFFTYDLLKVLLFHPSRLATSTIITALLYLYCNEYTLKNKLIFLLILAIGLISGRSKMYGFFVICTFFVFFINNNYRFKFNIKTIAVLCMLVAAVVFVSWNKIHFYFIQGGFGDDRETQDLYARMALYFFSLQIFKDYFPFGSGFASFGTYLYGQPYSHI